MAEETALPQGGRSAGRRRRLYLRALAWAFTAFNSARIVAYLPNIYSIHTEADSSQHSLATWIILFGANATMAAWLYEQDGQRIGKVVAVNISNALMCLGTIVSIAWYRF